MRIIKFLSDVSKHSEHREYSLSGTYRKLMGQVQNFSWRIMRYNDPNYNLIRSDFEEMRGFEEPKDIEGRKVQSRVLIIQSIF